MRDARGMRMAALLGTVGIAWIAVITWAGTLHPGFSYAARSPLNAALLLTASVSAVGIGLIDWTRDSADRRGLSLALMGALWPLAAGANPGSGSSVIFTLALVLPYVCAPLSGDVAVCSLRGASRSRAAMGLVVLGWLGAVVLFGLVPSLLFQPVAEGCPTCPSNLLGFASAPDLARSVRAVGITVTVIGIAVTVVWLIGRLWRASGPARSASLPVVAPAAIVLLVVAIDAAIALPRRDPWPNEALWRACSLAIVATAIGVVVTWIRIAVIRQKIARLAVEIADAPQPSGLRALLADQLRDPSLIVAYTVGDGRTVDAAGRDIELAGGSDRRVTTITRDDETLARIEHRRTLADDPEHLDEVIRACRLALENERLQAASRARLEDLRASRERVVETGDAARQRLERDLHDGAQQRLVSLALALRICRSRLDPADSQSQHVLDVAERELRAAIDGLRTVAHGLYPAVLAEEGLAAGVEALRESSSVPIRIDGIPSERLPRPVEAAAWFAIEEATRGLERGQVALNVRRVDDRLLVDLEHDGTFPAELADVEDRIGALDGMLRVATGDGRSTLHAEIPCAS